MALTKVRYSMVKDAPANILDYGADSTGTNDSASAIQAALNSGATVVYAPAGTYKINTGITIPKNVSLFGDGSNLTKFDASTMPDANVVSFCHIRTADSTFTALPALSVNVVKNARTLTFASAPSVSVGDILNIYNPTDYSWLGYRSYYRAGEYVRVAAISGNVVTIEGSTVDAYVASDVDVYRHDNMTSASFKGFSVIGNPSSALPIRAFQVNGAHDTLLEDLRVYNSIYTGISLVKGYKVQLLNCSGSDDFVTTGTGGDYGLAISNCHIVNVSGGSYTSYRHGITIGGGSGVGATTNRYISIIGAYVGTTGGVQAFDMHGNSEYTIFADCSVDGGIVVAGDYSKVDNCNVRGDMVNGPVAIYFGELKGANHTVTNNTIQNNEDAPVRGNMIDVGGNSGSLTSNATRGGTLFISNNVMYSEVNGPTNTIKITNRGCTQEDINIVVSNNSINSLYANDYDDIESPVEIGTYIDKVSGSPFNVISCDGNNGCGGIVITSDSAYSCNVASIKNNVLRAGYSLAASYVKDTADVSNNSITDFYYGFGISSTASYPLTTGRICNNVSTNCGWRSTTTSTANAAIYMTQIANAIAQDNFTVGNPQRLDLTTAVGASFQTGETVTGGSSGDTATVYFGSSNYLYVKESASGSFTAGETITGSISGQTAVLDSVPLIASFPYSASYVSITNLWRGNQVDAAGRSAYTSSVSNDTAL